ncbi:MAG: class I SAM-dependent methyltransferase [Thermoproteota archaeon]|nr:class I SAM-dependent methyltransferase [Thermoproteota archaeon]
MDRMLCRGRLPFKLRVNMNLLQNPLNPILWTARRNEHDVISVYNYLSGLMRIITKDYFLNFGYWNKGIDSPREAQRRLCSLIADVSNLYSARTVLDIGSGFSVPAIYWKSLFNSLNIVCVDINLRQLKFGVFLQDDLKEKKITFLPPKDNTKEFKSSLELELPLQSEDTKKLSFVNATSTALPFGDNSVDRIITLESAQHFRPLSEFFMESNRVLEKNGIFVTAMPVIHNQARLHGNNIFSEMISSISIFLKLGVLSFTWMSEHYDLNYIKSQIINAGFQLKETKLVGSHVYEPLSEYYIQNREKLQSVILKEYPSHIEKILYKSISKMNELSEERVIDYAIIRADK